MNSKDLSTDKKVEEKKDSLADTRSPYLKAILSGASQLINSGRVLSMINPDRDAALRYIKESAMMRKC